MADPRLADALNQASELHSLLKINDRDWHQFKSNRQRRACEQISAALVYCLQNSYKGEKESIELLESALRWLKQEQRDPGCPAHAKK